MNKKLNIYLRKDGRYEGRIPIGRRPNGTIRYRSFYDYDKKQLIKRMKEEAKYREKSIPASKMRFQELFDLWLQEKEQKVKPSTLSIYRCHLRAHLIPLLGKKQLATLTAENLKGFCEEVLSQRCDGKGTLSVKSRIELLRTLNSVLRFGLEKGYFHQPFRVEYPRQEPQSIDVFREDEQAILEQTLSAHFPQKEAVGIYLCLYTGLRVGELCGLRWEDIDLDRGFLSVRRTVQRVAMPMGEQKTQVIVGEPKTPRSKRQIPLADNVIALLSSLKPSEPDTYFLSDTKKCFEPRRMQLAFRRYLDMAGLRKRGFHSTRHTFATRWVELDIDKKTLSEILGHAGIAVTLDKYVHISDKTKRENMKKFYPLTSLTIKNEPSKVA